MDFCDYCNNMLYIKQLEENNEMIFYCKTCNQEKKMTSDVDTQKSQKISSKDYDILNSYKQFINHNIIYDNTIPHVNNIKCVNENCTKTDSEDNDIMYIKYDAINIKYMYYCTYCKEFWMN